MKKIALIICLVALAGCQEAPRAYHSPPLSFTGPHVRLNVAQIKLVENYHSPMQAPYVEHAFPTPPALAVKQWLDQQVAAVGTQGAFEVTIDDASVKETILPKTTGIRGLLTDDQDRRYDLSLKVTLRLYNGADAMSVASGDVVITRSKTLNEKATINDRTQLFDTMTRDAMASFDREAQNRLQQYFTNYLR